MRLFESIIAANHRAVDGDASASVPVGEFAAELPVVALTCIDPRLNGFFPAALGLPPEQFIWLRNAGNIITSPMSSTMRSLALACAVKGGREIVIIGHSDCQVAHTTTMGLLEKLKALGVDRARLPDNLNEFFGTFGSERQNVIKACDFTRSSPLIGPKIPVHGFLMDIATGKLDWVVNGYETPAAAAPPTLSKAAFSTLGALGSFKDFEMGEMKFPEVKIGDAAARVEQPVHRQTAPVPPVIQPVISSNQSPETIARQVTQFADSHWPKAPDAPPPLKRSPLPPIRPKPPLNPHRDFKHG